MRTLILIALAAFSADAHAQERLPAYRSRLLGVYDARSGDPIEGVEVTDALAKISARTTKTGTVSLAFLPDGGALVQLRKPGYQPMTIVVAISPSDTIPLTILFAPVAQALPAVVTRDSARHYVSPGLRDFEERRHQGMGHFVAEAALRKNDAQRLTSVAQRLPGMIVKCNGSSCFAVSTRAVSKRAFGRGDCPVDISMGR